MKKLKQNNIFFLTLCLFFKQSLCLDPYYNLCLPKHCGDGLDITYPFFIHGLQDPSCGYAGFGLQCKNNSSTIKILDSEFRIRKIEYKIRTVRLQNTAVLTSINNSENCKNLDIQDFRTDARFEINNENTQNLTIISNCYSNSSLEHEMDQYRIRSIRSCKQNTTEYVILQIDPNMRKVKDGCGDGRLEVEAPVDLDGGEGVVNGRNYEEVVEKGFEMTWHAPDCGDCERSGGRCGFNTATSRFLCFCTDRPHGLSCKSGSVNNWKTQLTIGLGSAVLLIVIIFIIYCKMKSSSNSCVTLFKHKTEDDKSVEAFVTQYGSLTTKRYKYVDIKRMTNSFQVKLGQGGFGTVFKGKLSNGCLVAVKVLNSSKASGQEFINEVASIGRTSHINIITLLGFCFDYEKRALVYEFMPNGSLEKFIYFNVVPPKTSEHLGVEKLYEVALGIARGLDYLHRGCTTRILHLDIKPHNILLDEDFCPKIADFGLAKLYSRKESIVSMLEARGTIGYIAPEVFNRNFGEVSHKSDVYSYGMLILEMVGGRKNVDAGVGSGNTSEIYFPYWIYNRLKKDEYLIDGVTTVEENDYAKKMTIVGLWCIQTDPKQRPSINEVIEMLEGSTQVLEVPPKPYFCTPPRSQASTFEES